MIDQPVRHICSAVPFNVTGAGNNHGSSEMAGMRNIVFILVFVIGGITSLNDVMIPRLKAVFGLDYASALLAQTSFFAAYGLFPIAAARLARRVGYLTTASIGLLTMTAGCLMVAVAAAQSTFAAIQLGLFVLAAGVTTAGVVSNPLIATLGPAHSTHSRLTLGQAFNSAGTMVFTFLGSVAILGDAGKSGTSVWGAAEPGHPDRSTWPITAVYCGLAVILVLAVALVWSRRRRLPMAADTSGSLLSDFMILRRDGLLRTKRSFALGTACIFLYVGAEVAIGSLLVNFLMLRDTLALGPEAAGKHVPVYWGAALLGRLGGAALLRVVAPAKALACAAIVAIVLLGTSAGVSGAVSAYALLLVGLANSIMFPTIFGLACEDLGPRAAEGAGIVVTAVVGGAIIPPLTGMVADASNLRSAFVLPGCCYALIALYGWSAGRFTTSAD